ncbi:MULTISPECIES: hypothetical protein [unclassified Methylobacterium]|uniref:hypothetical protein n=1 Tax=unclassified Methylobacterium TaxID=2615210 RepID=UPI0009DD3728|nr:MULTISPECIES: hypothetical protein [unclassified Methylobacterium]
MTIKMKTACLGLSVFALASPALSQGTPEQQQACTPDAMSLCQNYIPDAGRVRACLLSRRASLSPACRAAIAAGEPKSSAPRKRRRRHS